MEPAIPQHSFRGSKEQWDPFNLYLIIYIRDLLQKGINFYNGLLLRWRRHISHHIFFFVFFFFVCRGRVGTGGKCADGAGGPVGLGRPRSVGAVQRRRGHLRRFPQREMVPRIATRLRLQWAGQSGTVGRIVDQQVFSKVPVERTPISLLTVDIGECALCNISTEQ